MGVTAREKYKGSGVWWVFICYKGQEESKKIGPQSLAEEVAERYRAKIALGQYSPRQKESNKSFKTYSQRWLDTYVSAALRESTKERYQTVLKKYIWPKIGTRNITAITRGDVRGLILALMKEGKSSSLLRAVRDVVSGIFTSAVDDEIVQVNPCIGLLKALGVKKKKRTDVEPFTGDDVDVILSECLKWYPESYPMLMVAFRTGMRLGEILGLKWDDINWRGGLVSVQRSYRNQKVSSTKTGESRLVEISPQLQEELQRLHTQKKKDSLMAGRGEPVEWIFNQGSHPSAQNSVRYIWRRVLRSAKLNYRKFHATRHTYASLLLARGVNLQYVSQQLGHSSIQMTADIYSHFIPTESRRDVGILDSDVEKGKKRAGKNE